MTTVHITNTSGQKASLSIDDPDLVAHLQVMGKRGDFESVSVEDTDDLDDAAPRPPAKSASKAEWVAWAVAQGVDEAEAEAQTRNQLAEMYGPKHPEA